MCLPEDWLHLNKIGFCFVFFQSGPKIRCHGSTMSFRFQKRQYFPGLISQVLPRVFQVSLGASRRNFHLSGITCCFQWMAPTLGCKSCCKKQPFTWVLESYWINKKLLNCPLKCLLQRIGKKETNIKIEIRMTSFFF